MAEANLSEVRIDEGPLVMGLLSRNECNEQNGISGISGRGLGLWWRHEVEIQILGSRINYIDSIVVYPKDGFHFQGS
ncbi:unnamed protein product [Prunus brigantina]